MTTRRAGAALFGAFVGAWIARAIFRWILDVPGDVQIVLIVATALVGAVLCVLGEQETRAKAPDPAEE